MAEIIYPWDIKTEYHLPTQTESAPEHVTKFCEESFRKAAQLLESQCFGFEGQQFDYAFRANFGIKTEYKPFSMIQTCVA